MFGLLKNKISNFIGSIAGSAAKEEPKEIETPAQAAQEPIAEREVIIVNKKIEIPKAHAPVGHEAHEHLHPHHAEEHHHHEPIVTEPRAEPIVSEKREEETHATPEHRNTQAEPARTIVEQHKPIAVHQEEKKIVETPQPVKQTPEYVPPKVAPKNVEKPAELPSRPREERDLGPKIGILDRVKSIFTNEVTIGDAEAKPLFDGLEMALLESDVSYDTTQALVESMRGKIIGMKTGRSNVEGAVKGAVRQSFLELFSNNSFDLFNFIAAKKAKGEPAVILMVGPNGAGKTTTIAKLASQMQAKGFTCIIAAGDTFRKAAIEQAVIHGQKLGVRVVKHDYGADPTAVAFDAISAAKANAIDVVLIDTAGRQETNTNLVKEMQKMERVLHPDLKIFVGEAIAGNSLIEQIKSFHTAIKLDGIMLTKLDCDAKGGGAFSIAYETKLPIIMVGVGQEYSDLRPFDAEWIVDNVFAA